MYMLIFGSCNEGRAQIYTLLAMDYTHTHTHTHTHNYTGTCTRVHRHTNTCTGIHIHIHIPIRTHMASPVLHGLRLKSAGKTVTCPSPPTPGRAAILPWQANVPVHIDGDVHAPEHAADPTPASAAASAAAHVPLAGFSTKRTDAVPNS